MNATDLDATTGLEYAIVEPVTAVDRDGKPVEITGIPEQDVFKYFFAVNSETGEVFVNAPLDRSVAAIVTMTVQITDTSATPPQVKNTDRQTD